MLEEKRAHYMPVQHLRAIPGERGHAPQQEQALAKHKERNVFQQCTARKVQTPYPKHFLYFGNSLES